MSDAVSDKRGGGVEFFLTENAQETITAKGK